MKAHTLLTTMTLGWTTLLIGADAAHPRDTPAPQATVNALPADYASTLRRVGEPVYDEKSGVTTVFANELAASVAGFSQERYPGGSIIVMEFAEPQRDGEGEPMRDPRGQPLKGKVDYLAVMRRVAGYGAVYGEDRAGEWEFSTYRPDGSPLIAPAAAVQCASCHRKAGSERDFVYRLRKWSVQ